MSISKLKRWMLGRTPDVRSDSSQDKLQHDHQHIAILAQVATADEIDSIKQYIHRRSIEGKAVSCLLYSRDKRMQDDLLLDNKRVKWSGAPTCEKTSEFLSQSYDVLYVPCKEYGVTLEYIIKQCAARLKTGAYEKPKAHYFDIVADTQKVKIIDIINEIDIILSKLIKNG